jgi:PAS domain S-box-containing protein
VGQDKKVADIMTTSLVMMHADASLVEAAARMEAEGVSSILLEVDGRPEGILTERDIMRALGQGMPLDGAAAGLMTRGLISVSTDETIHAAFHLMVINAIRHLVVVDGLGRMVGILSESDFRKHRGVESFVAALDVGRAMSQSHVVVTGDCSLQEAARQMQVRKASCALVMDGERPAGIVTERDMVRLFRADSGDRPMREVMTSPVATVGPKQLLVDAVRQMQQQRIRRLAVVAEDGKLLGVLNEHDVVRHLEDEYVQMLQQIVVQQAQALNQDKFRAVVDTIPDRIILKDLDSRYLSCNASYASDLGIKPDAIVGMSDFDFFPPELAERYREDDRKVMQSGMQVSFEEPYIKDGERRWIQTTKAPMRNDQGEVVGVVVMFHDITQRRRSLDLLHQRTWALEALSACNKAMLHAHTEEEMWQKACVAITANEQYPLACVGWADQDEARSLMLLAFGGKGQAALRGWRGTWRTGAEGDTPYGNAVRTGQAQRVDDMASDTPPWATTFVEHGMRACLALPVSLDGKVLGVMTLFALESEAFSPDVVRLFEEMVGNISYGITSLRQRLAYLESLESQRLQTVALERSLEDALTAIAATLEQRDPYTAGHQKHVADLALLIGKEMGLDAMRLKGLYLAGIVHDVGKIQIPSEILTKPGRLNAAEFALIKCHPEVGYNILKGIAFPWSIADIVRQHHEYLDGSGYPLGIGGDRILLESRILTVADIVESMSADRPYRPAMGLAKAMLEIGRLSVSKLDARVVEACVEVLRRGDFTPSELKMEE